MMIFGIEESHSLCRDERRLLGTRGYFLNSVIFSCKGNVDTAVEIHKIYEHGIHII